MRNSTRISPSLRTNLFAVLIAVACVVAVSAVRAQVSGGTDRNTSKMANYQNECAIAKNPTNKLQLFASCNNATGGLFATRSTDGGLTWVYPDADKTIADGDANQGSLACCDPTLAWDNFGNLFVTYLGDANTIVTLLSTDGGATFSTVATFGPASVDQPTVAAAAGQVWVVWNQSNQMVTRGAPVTGLGAANVGAFIPLVTIPNTVACTFGDLAIAPGGAVVQTCQTPVGGQGPATIRVNTDPDGLGPNPFNAGVAATTTNVGGFDVIPAQATRTVDAEAGLAFDALDAVNANPASPHFGRLYLVYNDETANENNDTDVMLRFSDDNGGTWSNPPIRVNDDATTRSQFLPRIASNPLSGNIAVCWHDARNSATNTAMQEFCSIATPTGATPAFFANAQVGDGTSAGTGSNPPAAGQLDIQFGDYSGLAYFQGLAHPIWADVSNSTGDNPDGTSRWDAYTDRVTGGPAANEGDPHITTVDGIHYDFQSAGEFVVLRDRSGMQIQTRQTAIPTASVIGNSYTGLTTCVSLNTAVAARVGTRRVTFQPNLSGQPDPTGLQLRVDGRLTTLPSTGLNFGGGGRVLASAGGGIQVDFPDETTLVVTPGWWSSQSKWYLNVNVFHTSALEGVMGARSPGSWLPALADGTSLGAKPAAAHQRYVDLYQKFADSWRVTNSTSLFDYAPGTSTSTFTVASWPLEQPPCVLPETTPVQPATLAVAQRACRAVVGKNRKADCVFDVQVTGEIGFAKTYMLSQKIETGTTQVVVIDDKDPTRPDELVVFTASVARVQGKGVPTGTVQFIVDGKQVGPAVKLDARGQARWRTKDLRPGTHQVSAQYLPDKDGAYLASTSLDESHVVADQQAPAAN